MIPSESNSERLTRKRLIDPKLKAAGWKVVALAPQKPLISDDPCAIEEFETANGPADYALCIDGQIIAVVEAKKLTISPQGVLMQAERYSKGIINSPFNYRGFRVPFLYSTNGEVIWYHDIRHELSRSVSFAQAGPTIKHILFDEVCVEPNTKARCEKYAQEGEFRNLDHFLESLVLDKEFRALVIIDEETEDLHAVTKNLGFPVEIIEFSGYINDKGEYIHRFDPFLADVEAVDVKVAEDEPVQKQVPRDRSDLDTVVVPAHEDGFQRVFRGENRWWAVRIHPSMVKQLKYVAAYITTPRQEITHYAPIRSIEPWENTGKMVINFAEPAKEIGPLKLTKNGKVTHLQGLRYTNFEKLKKATSLDEVF